MRLAVHVTPRAARDEVVGWRGSELAVRVTAVPEGGKANEAVCRTIADSLGVPKSAVRVVRGQTGRHKSLEVDVGASVLEGTFGLPDESLF